MDTGLYPADQYKPGTNYKAYDWSGYDEDDFPASVRQQIETERRAKAPKPKGKDAFRKAATKRPAATKVKP